jgi:outer membrane protein OmpA-like peptidoglycan-associated protein
MRITLVLIAAAITLSPCASFAGQSSLDARQPSPEARTLIQQLKPPGPPLGIPGISPPTNSKPVTPPASGCPKQDESASVGYATQPVYFDNGSAKLTPRTLAVLKYIGEALRNDELAPYRYTVEGHTDTTGTANGNLVLSQQRAKAVVEYLSTNLGVARSRLEPVGKGEQGLLISTGPGISEPCNRRVMLVLLTETK